MTRIRMVALGPANEDEKREWLAAIGRTLDSRAYCLGDEVTTFEDAVRSFLDVPEAVGLSNGTDALRLALAALGVEAGDEVIVPAFSFFATASSVAHLGARPRFVDVEPETLSLDPAVVAEAIGERTRAVIPVHLYGQGGCELASLLALLVERGIPALEDAAQAFGVRYRGRALGSLGAAGVFSFYPTKNLAAAGDAGMLVSRDPEVAARVRSLRVHGDAGGYWHETLGWNARMDGFQAAILKLQLQRLPEFNRRRAENAERYREAIADANLGDRVVPLRRTEGSEHGWHQFVVRVTRRDDLQASLARAGIDSAVYYPATLPAQPAFAYLGHRVGEFPHAERAAREVLALPVHHGLHPDDPAQVVAAIRRFFET